MEEEIINFSTFELAYQKGFLYRQRIITSWIEEKESCQLDSNGVSQAFLQKWLREKYNLDIIITSNLLGYGYLIYQRYPSKNITNLNVYQTYEEALEVALIECLNLIEL